MNLSEAENPASYDVIVPDNSSNYRVLLGTTSSTRRRQDAKV